jgi:sporulation protein YlmC with PRC-barrel domain
MFRKVILCALASATMIPAAAMAQHGPPGGMPGGAMGGPPGGVGGMGNSGGFGPGGPGGMGSINGMGGINGIGSTMRDQGRLNSQGPANASPTGIAHANSNSVLSGSSTSTLNRMFPGTRTTSTVSSGALAGLTTGMTLTSNGTAVGTVQQIRTTGNGSVSVIIVQGANGGFYAVPASQLSLSGGTLSTTAHLAGVNNRTTTMAFTNPAIGHSQGPAHASATGIAHANYHSVLAGGAVTSSALPGLTAGLTVKTSGGTTLGTVSQVVTGSDGSIRQVIVTSSTGQTYRLSPSMLSISGGIVTTTQSVG